MQVTVDTTTERGTGFPSQRGIFHALGLYWLFGADGEDIVWWTSSDGVTWSAKSVVPFTIPASIAQHFSVRHYVWEGTPYVYIIGGVPVTMVALEFIRGVLSSDGTIAWETPITVATPSTFLHYSMPDIEVLTDGSLIVVVCRGTATYHGISAYMNPLNDGTGTWTLTVIMSPVSIEACSFPSISRLPNGQAYVCAGRYGTIHGNFWNGTEWVGEEVIDPATTNSNFISTNYLDGTVYLTFLDTADDVTYMRIRDPTGVWSARETISPLADVYEQTLTVSNVGNCYTFGGDVPSAKGAMRGFKRVAEVWEPLGLVAPNEPYTDKWSVTSSLKLIDFNVPIAWTRGLYAPYEIRFMLYKVIVPIPRLTGDSLTQTIYVS